jgi:uncharacterized protein (TIRG00374 family)
MSLFETRRGVKLWAGVIIGIIVVVLLFYLNSGQVRFIESSVGDYCWKDVNGNQKVDLYNSNEFYLCYNGGYRKETLSDVIKTIVWTKKSLVFLLGALICIGLRDLFYILRIRILSDGELSWKSSFHSIMLWEFASALSPGVMSGAAVAMFILNRERIPLGKSTAMVMVTAMLDNLFFALMIPLVFLIYGSNSIFPESSALEKVFWLGYSGLLLVFVFFLLAIFFPNLVPSVLRIVTLLPLIRRWKEKADRLASDIRISASEIKLFRPKRWFLLLVTTFGSWISRFLVVNLLMAAFLKLSSLTHFLILSKQFILWLFMRMSPTPGGSGVAEFMFGELMAPFGGSALLILGLAFVWRILSYYGYLVIGSFILPRWLGKINRSV